MQKAAAAAPQGCPLSAHGLDLWLLAGRAVWWPQAQMLLVADLHFGKASTFRRAGQPVPQGTTADNLARLSGLLDATGARHLVFLGDLLHARSGADSALWAALQRWREGHRDLLITLVRGNHDRHAGDPVAALDMQVVDEPWRPLPQAPLLACHHPQQHPGALSLAGHLHPSVRLGGRGRDSLRVPCFVWDGDQLILPAFGAFTGSAAWGWSPQARVFAVAEPCVLALPPGAGA